jgi:hypothetical protein
VGDDEHRHRCLVRWLIKKRMNNRDAAHKWLYGYTDENGKFRKGWNGLHTDSILERDSIDQFNRGNRGEGWL